ncbi:MAG TPA: bifunctional precorrin-2 dehydrogenase/sirohydrochlorin ferrochelatase [Cytophagales bacterium]|nr:bifunctional precorrin-2 dehydrogenase/sirohydrochlorin ferrochelatase [Cytophagales bacterium]
MKEVQLPEQKENNQLFPIFLKLHSLHTLIIGGRYVGFEKLNAVLSNSPEAKVTLVAIEISEEVKKLASHHPNVTLLNRSFEESDLEGKDLVIIGTNDNELNRSIQGLSKKNKVLTNVADTPELCDFYLSSVVQKGNLKIAISTNGKSPTVAKRVKEMLNESFPSELDKVLDNLSQIRNKLKGDFTEKVKQLDGITSVLVENKKKKTRKTIQIIISVGVALALMILGHLIFRSIL